MSTILFVGAGGSGVSALARLFLQLGYTNLLGVEKYETQQSKLLEQAGLPIVTIGNYEVKPTDIVIYSAARIDAPEVQQAFSYVGSNPKKVSPPYLYFEFLGELSKHFITLSVAGTHGKSTTTGLLGVTLAKVHPQAALCLSGAGVTDWQNENMRYNPLHAEHIKTIINSIIDPKAPTSTHLLKQLLFTIEADEYNKHFLHLDTDYSIITSLELDHSDIYPTEKEYLETFDVFIEKTKKQIYLPQGINHQDRYENYPLVTIVPTEQFDFQHLVGGHNHSNASLALALATDLIQQSAGAVQREKSLPTFKYILESNRGLRRRCELIGTTPHGTAIISDYAHHPTELLSTYRALQEQYPDKELLTVFQPHQVRRVLEFWEYFIDVLSEIDQCVLYDIYAAREDLDNLKKQFGNTATSTISSINELGNLLATISKHTYTDSFSDIVHMLDAATDKQLIVLFTAGGLDYQVRAYLGV